MYEDDDELREQSTPTEGVDEGDDKGGLHDPEAVAMGAGEEAANQEAKAVVEEPRLPYMLVGKGGRRRIERGRKPGG